MDIRVTDNYELRPVKGGLDWQVYEFKEVEKKKDGSKSEEWVGLPAYFAEPVHALRYVLNRIPKTGNADVRADLQGAIDEFRAIEREIGKHAKALERAMKEGK